MTWPKTFTGANAPTEMLDLVGRLMPLLLAGDHPAAAALREQYALAQIHRIELTGVGFVVEFAVPPNAPRTEPNDFAGGQVHMQVEGVVHGAACLLFVRAGVIAALEGYTYDDEWPEHPLVIALTQSIPVVLRDTEDDSRGSSRAGQGVCRGGAGVDRAPVSNGNDEIKPPE
jgi:hypothetical protein